MANFNKSLELISSSFLLKFTLWFSIVLLEIKSTSAISSFVLSSEINKSILFSVEVSSRSNVVILSYPGS